MDKPDELVRRLWSSQGRNRSVRTARQMAVLRGKGVGLEVTFPAGDFENALAELQSKLCERPGFYTGASASLALGASPSAQEQLETVRALLSEHGVVVESLLGGNELQPLAEANGLRFVLQDADGGEELARRRALRPKREVVLSDAARSLVADFAGARDDIATRRRKGETSVRRVSLPVREPVQPQPAAAAPELAVPPTLYHTGTLRGGQSLHHAGNIVIVGDVNPGAEVIATGDILVFGSLRGVAHAGAQGDASARVHALELAPTQLRIATSIAADTGGRKSASPRPETAIVKNDRITIFPRGASTP